MKSESKAYHHGDLRQALISATEAILTERGLDGFSMREAARRAGVSPAAPAHHFGDARGLLTAVATGGFLGLQAALRAANAEGQDRTGRIHAQARAYIRYGVTHPAQFDLMWRCEALDQGDEAYIAASVGAFLLLNEQVTGVHVELDQALPGNRPQVDPRVIAAWSLVHGYTSLARLGMFDPDAPGLLDGVLATLTV